MRIVRGVALQSPFLYVFESAIKSREIDTMREILLKINKWNYLIEDEETDDREFENIIRFHVNSFLTQNEILREF